MIGVILAAGMAKRLRPLTDKCPKCLLKVGERTLLQRTVDAQLAAGITELVVVTGYRGEMIRDFLTEHYIESSKFFAEQSGRAERKAQNSKLTIHFIHNADYEHNNNIFSLWMTRPYTDGKDFLLMDSDILCDPQIIKRVMQEEDSVLALNRHELGEEEIKVIVDEENRVLEISKVCSIEQAIGESVGIEKMTAEYSTALFRELEQMIEGEGLIDIFYERAFERLIPQGHTFRVVDTTDFFSYEIDTPEDYERANELFARFGNPQHS